MFDRHKAEIVLLWIMLRMKKLHAAGLINPIGDAETISPKGEARVLEHFKLHQPPARIDIEHACEWLFNRGPLSNTPRQHVPGLITLICDWKE